MYDYHENLSNLYTKKIIFSDKFEIDQNKPDEKN